MTIFLRILISTVLDILRLVFCRIAEGNVDCHRFCTPQNANYIHVVERDSAKMNRFCIRKNCDIHLHLKYKLYNTPAAPRPFRSVEIVELCAEYMNRVRSGSSVPFIFCAERSKISLIKKPDRIRTNCGVPLNL